MIIYDCCSNVDFDKVYKGFQVGFSDYMIKFDISKEDFLKRFFGPEGNNLAHSFIAFDDGNPIGVILGGMKDYEGTKTLRCGGLCVHPEYRGKGISKEFFKLHKQVAVDNGCKQLFLEVIVGNNRAIKFYENLGYDKVYDLIYYSLKDTAGLHSENHSLVNIRPIDFDAVLNLSWEIKDTHINWQNDFDYVKKIQGLVHYGAYEGSTLIGALTINPVNGKIFFIWTRNQYRHRGIGRSLLAKAVSDLNLNSLTISFPNNASIECFVKHIGFQKDKLSQYEMYLPI